MFGADYAWILHEGMMIPSWWNLSSSSSMLLNNNHDCLQYQLYDAIENLIIVSSHNSIVGNDISLSGLVCNIHLYIDDFFIFVLFLVYFLFFYFIAVVFSKYIIIYI